jgi:hypothetical protein
LRLSRDDAGRLREPTTGRYLTQQQMHALAFATPHRKQVATVIKGAGFAI